MQQFKSKERNQFLQGTVQNIYGLSIYVLKSITLIDFQVQTELCIQLRIETYEKQESKGEIMETK